MKRSRTPASSSPPSRGLGDSAPEPSDLCSFPATVPTSLESVDLASITQEEKLRWGKCGWVWCRTCGGGSISKSGWSHKTRTQHDVVSLKNAGKEEEALREFIFITRGGKLAQQAVASQKRAQQKGKRADGVPTPVAYALDFGKHKGDTIPEVLDSSEEKIRDYIPWLFASAPKQGLSPQLQGLKMALEKEGRWGQVWDRAQAMQPNLRKRHVEKKAEVDALVARGEHVHPEVMKLRTLQAEKATRDGLGPHSVAWADSALPVRDRPQARAHRSQAYLENTHCSYCGEVGHRLPGCRKAKEDMDAQALGVQAIPQAADLPAEEKRIARIIAHLKYTWPHQRTAVYEGLKPRAQEQQAVTGHILCRMSAKDMCKFGVEWGLLDDLQGTPCTNTRCQPDAMANAAGGGGFAEGNVLGQLCAKGDCYKVTTNSAWLKCKACRRRHSVHMGNPLYSARDRVEDAHYAWWMFINKAPLTLAALHMGRREDLVRRYYQIAARICSRDALKRQAHIIFGHRHPMTTICEADETRIGKFKVVINGTQYYYHLVLLGVVARGDPSSLWLLLVGLTRSTDRSRVPPLKKYIWRMVANTIFDKDSHIVNMTDGACAYDQDVVGVVERFSVNHQLKEWTRPVNALANAETLERRATLASTNFLDSTWRKLKAQLPGGLSIRTQGGIKTKMHFVRSAQWRMLIRGQDPWAAFCTAAVAWKNDRHPAGAAAAEGDDLWRDGDEPVDGDADEILDGDLPLAEAGMESIPFGFEATGDWSVLARERRARADTPMEDSIAGAIALGASNWDADTNSDHTEICDDFEEEAANDGAIGSPVAKRGCPSAKIGPVDATIAPVEDDDAFHEEMRSALEDVKSELCARFKNIAPTDALGTYTAYVYSEAFDERVLKEVLAIGGFPDHLQAGDLAEWLVLLVDRKEVDLKGMVANSRVPSGFERGAGSTKGNNCFISSVVQCLRGAAASGFDHEEECAALRRAGSGNVWGERDFIVASPETLLFVATAVLGQEGDVTCTIYSAHDGSNVTVVRTGHVGDHARAHDISLFNPVGVHFDPLWRQA